ncbi:hypothetical protein CAter282_2583 [Collimonas arenae]|uniref:Uncharacterized protein n=1 Tax=Collimonas arenae TaxID=279058 RepID=A0A127QJR4_9BURK|nr:hypothetical protein CAter10_2846 [Collimonas arenae]AMP10320.1 hypothetical protein CAter282_2583 [Collimonas arenae]
MKQAEQIEQVPIPEDGDTIRYKLQNGNLSRTLQIDMEI